jgi:hypothetical protein
MKKNRGSKISWHCPFKKLIELWEVFYVNARWKIKRVQLKLVSYALKILEYYCVAWRGNAFSTIQYIHRYLMRRLLPLHGVYLWRHLLSTAPPFTYIMVVNIWNTFWPPPAQFFLPRKAALTTNSNGTQSAHKGRGGGRYRYYSYIYEYISMSRTACCLPPIKSR